MTDRTANHGPGRGGFTLIELLIVIIVLAILSTIIVPAVISVIALADDRQAEAFIQEVSMSARSFAGDNNQRYPGQDDVGQLAGSTPVGLYTGSQILAARLFGYPDDQIGGGVPPGMTNKYLSYKVHLLIEHKGRKNSLGDNSKSSMPLLYYPSRPGETTPSGCYKWADNSAYVGASSNSGKFSDYSTVNIKQTGGQTLNTPRNEGQFLLIGTGPNDRYFETDTENDDNKNWDTK